MGKLVLEVPVAIDMKLKARNIPEAIKKLTQLKWLHLSKSRQKNMVKRIRKFRGIAKYKDIERSKDEWYHQ
ncbi:MAG: hypothetical protein GTO45_21370 [Candidatus Aminicenantes bacterium]|nr:hypothetical protein [Candidatus Aminicenantes bacterium]NIM81306.1 hypothetical protein [Candidatus Aminicenantes bacterium]NIN20716.1 hypothetical protein [Candidatus Aminicenantes bacterium]NIN44492.1 hypothetical protein [Candidatus Aminicenantes bacterium]NIN87314.1 hypothetical protein [Candidatus Aminicenantes bacterium]